MSACRSCGAQIIWAKTAAGKAMPLDAEPERRLVPVQHPGPGNAADVLSPWPPDDARGNVRVVVHDTYVSHFATCPNADEHRRPK